MANSEEKLHFQNSQSENNNSDLQSSSNESSEGLGSNLSDSDSKAV